MFEELALLFASITVWVHAKSADDAHQHLRHQRTFAQITNKKLDLSLLNS
jgi:hypothetical protein